jgi:hypothetical protein
MMMMMIDGETLQDPSCVGNAMHQVPTSAAVKTVAKSAKPATIIFEGRKSATLVV